MVVSQVPDTAPIDGRDRIHAPLVEHYVMMMKVLLGGKLHSGLRPPATWDCVPEAFASAKASIPVPAVVSGRLEGGAQQSMSARPVLIIPDDGADPQGPPWHQSGRRLAQSLSAFQLAVGLVKDGVHQLGGRTFPAFPHFSMYYLAVLIAFSVAALPPGTQSCSGDV